MGGGPEIVKWGRDEQNNRLTRELLESWIINLLQVSMHHAKHFPSRGLNNNQILRPSIRTTVEVMRKTLKLFNTSF